MEMTTTSVSNWEKYVETGDNALLGDIRIADASEGTEAILAGEGWERKIVVGA